MWKRETQVNPLYQNELDFEADEGEDALEVERRRRAAKRDSVASMQGSRGYNHLGHPHPVVARAMDREREGDTLGVGGGGAASKGSSNISPGSSRRGSVFEKLWNI